MDDKAISVEQVSKAFKLPHEKNSSIKGAVINFYHRKRSYEHQKALENINFDIKKGEFFGIVGRNGSGKSTLLKLLAGIYIPDKGTVTVNGKLTPFIELGVGFNPELTGRENVFLNGALLGFDRKEMAAMYDDIVNFAEIEKFMDQKLKNYSSGMQVRLAFSIAIRVKTDVLILDEVLAVGDEAFQKKCTKVFDEYKRNDQTIVLVTHDMETVKKYCDRAMLINNGEVIDQGNPYEIANMYSKLNQENVTVEQAKTSSDLKIKVRKSAHGNQRFEYNEKLKVTLTWPVNKSVKTAGVAIYSSLGERVFATNTKLDDYTLEGQKLDYEVDLKLGAGDYFVMSGIWDEAMEVLDFVSHGPEFIVDEAPDIPGEGLVRLEHRWSHGQ